MIERERERVGNEREETKVWGKSSKVGIQKHRVGRRRERVGFWKRPSNKVIVSSAKQTTVKGEEKERRALLLGLEESLKTPDIHKKFTRNHKTNAGVEERESDRERERGGNDMTRLGR